MKESPASGERTRGWRAEAALFLAAGLLETAFFGQLVAFTPQHLPTLGIPASQVGEFTGLVASLTMFIAFPALQRWGHLADQLTHKQVIVRSFLLDAFVAAAAILAGRPWIFLLGRAITLAAMDANGLLLNYLEKRRSAGQPGWLVPVMALAPQLGVFLGPLAGGFLLDRLGFQVLMGANLLFLLLLALLMQSMVRSVDVVQENRPILGILKESLNLVIRSPRISLLYLALTLMVAAWMLVFSYLPLTVTSLPAGFSPGTAVGLVLGLGGAVGILFSWGLVRIIGLKFEWPALAAGVWVAAVCSFLITKAYEIHQLLLLWAVISGLIATGFTLLIRLVGRSAARVSVPLALSLAILPVNGGMILGPVMGSLLSRPHIFQVYPAAAVFNLLGLAVLVVAALLPPPGLRPDAA